MSFLDSFFKTKYADDYSKIEQAKQEKQANPPDLREDGFSLPDHLASGAASGAFSWLIRRLILPVVLWRRTPMRLGFTWVGRHEQVEAILSAHDAFEVPFGREMSQMTGGVNFGLGDDGELHDRQRPLMIELLRETINRDEITATAELVGNALLDDSGGRINAVRDFLTRATAEICLKVYGIETSSADRFAEYSMAGSALLFADPFGTPAYRRQAMIASKRLREILDTNITRYLHEGSDAPGLLPALVAKAKENPETVSGPGATLDDALDEVRAMMFGLITGFIPTNALAAAKILEELSQRADPFAEACRLARRYHDPDDGEPKGRTRRQLQNVLMEALRFNPALFPGQFRVCKSADFEGKDRFAGFTFEPGETMMVATAAALMDDSAFDDPKKFRPERYGEGEDATNFLFGHGIHKCVGEHLSKWIITELFLVLLNRPGLKFAARKPKMTSVGPIPWKLDMVFDAEAGQRQRSMITAAIPLTGEDGANAVREMLRGWQADGSLAKGLGLSNVIHFASLNVVELGDAGESRPTLLIELSADGAPEQVIDRIFSTAGGRLDQLEPHLAAKPKPASARGGNERSTTNRLFIDHMVRLNTWPWGAIGLEFPGTGEFSVRQIEREEALYRHVREQVSRLTSGPDTERTGEPLVKQVRRALVGTEFEDMLYRPDERRPAFARFPTRSYNEFLATYFTSKPYVVGAIAFAALTVLVPLIVLFVASFFTALTAYVVVWMLPLLLLISAGIIFIFILRRRETKTEIPDDRFADHEHMRRLLAMEDLPGHAQNHLTSVSDLKPGYFRILTTAIALYVIKMMVVFWFRPGFVTDFATIHYAKWFRLPGTRKLIFQTNYDGSWESYLEDFVTKAHGGQTIAWNNAVGFPRTNWLFLDGAQDGDQFKRWVRRQQVETLFWYSHFPMATTDRIRANALVRDGLARACSASEYHAWQNLFGAAPRYETSIETDRVQSLLFGGLGRHPVARLHALRFPKGGQDGAGQWIERLARDWINCESASNRSDGHMGIAFGDADPDLPVRFVGFTAQGLRYLGMTSGEPNCGLASFPMSFVEGMARRARILGDEPDKVAKWLWTDWAEGEEDERAAAGECHALILHYARSEAELAKLEDQLAEEYEEFSITDLRQIRLNSAPRSNSREPFGFRDGISQPVMTGTQQFARDRHGRDDVVGPGEFVMGYPDSRGYFPISPQVSQRTPAAAGLPAPVAAIPGENPQFDNPHLTDMRDVGRNGSFLVVRQLRQDREAFDALLERHAQSGGWSHAHHAAGQKAGEEVLDVDAIARGNVHAGRYEKVRNKELLAAKIVGRWQDGSSLTRNPSLPATRGLRGRMFDQLTRQLATRAEDVLPPDASPDTKPTGEAATLLSLLANFRPPFGRGDQKAWRIIEEHSIAPSHVAPEARIALEDAMWDEASWTKLREILTAMDVQGIRLAIAQELRETPVPDNDFRHGTDDPQGIYCPLGSHIRRTNPRDSFRPGSTDQMNISNRHRLLRRGRNYFLQDVGDYEAEHADGTMFMCFNANIERQFEFVQQTWVNSRSFHGARNAPDPLIAPKTDGDEFIVQTTGISRTIPLAQRDDAGTMNDFVHMEGGGYFFFPGRLALEFLGKLAQQR